MNSRTMRTAPLESNLDRTLEKLGCEALIRQKYPELYKAILNTRERNKTACLRNSCASGEYIFGTEDSCKIRTLNYSPDTTLSTVSGMEMETPKDSLAIIGDISDAETRKSIDGFAVTENNTDTLLGKSMTQSSSLVVENSKQFIAKSSFIVVEKDENGKSIVRTLDSVMNAKKIVENETVVKKLEVTAPIPVNHLGADHIAVYYNRTGSRADYCYSNVKFNNSSIEVLMPFSGSVEFNGIYMPDTSNPIVWDGDNGLILQIENVRNGCANFDVKHKDEVKWNVTGSVLSWEFPDRWYDVLSKNKLTCANDMNFYCKMYINTTIGVPIPIVIQSNGEEHEDPSYKKIPYINILWGCFAKDVLIEMENGRSIPIEQVKMGDKVMTMDGSVHTVTEVVAGHEEKLVHIKSASGNRIRVSLDHPVLTENGMVDARNLTAGTILITKDGKESIESLYLVHYYDTVYNLRLDSDGILIANNFYAGDFATQNRKVKRVVTSIPRKTEDIQLELADFIKSVNEHQQ